VPAKKSTNKLDIKRNTQQTFPATQLYFDLTSITSTSFSN